MRSCFLLLSILLFCSFDQPKLVKTEVSPGVTVSIPADFTPMTDDDIARKYFTFRKPVAMYTSADGTVDFGFNIAGSRWRDEDLAIAKDFYLSTLETMYSKLDFIQKGEVKTINKHPFAVFEFVSEVIDDDPQSLTKGSVVRQYSYIQYALHDKQALVFNFTCPSRLKDRWQPVARAIMETVKVK